ncbi:MAG: hypothetical protein HY999_06115, partial [Nitrospinae bacterium]|nr:hypothetical protein [Nitrospinota bacterium]
ITSFIQKLPFIEKGYRYYLPIMPFAIEQFDLSGYDLIISSSHCVAKDISDYNPHPFHPTGIFFYEQKVESLIEAVRYFEDNSSSFKKEKIREHARGFDRSIFRKMIKGVIMDKYEQYKKMRG